MTITKLTDPDYAVECPSCGKQEGEPCIANLGNGKTVESVCIARALAASIARREEESCPKSSS